MRISAKAVYASMAIFELALRGSKHPVQARDIAQKQKIPFKFLEQILVQLKNAGIVSSVRGASGGYRLDLPAEDLSLKDVFQAIEGEARFLETEITDSTLNHAWLEIEEKMMGVLSEFKLSELIDRKQKENESWHYQI